MLLLKLPSHDRQVIFECLTAAATGPFFTDYDVSVLFGVTRQEFLGVVAQIPHLEDSEPGVRSAIGHALNGLLRYPHGHGASWDNWISASPEEVARNRATLEEATAAD